MQQLAFLKDSQNQQNAAKFAEILTLLIGKGYEGIRPVAWKPESGAFTKLRNYCALYARLGDDEDRQAFDLHQITDVIWLTLGHCLKHLRDEGEIPQPLLKKIFQLETRLLGALKKIIFDFREDENVLFFLLRHRQALDLMFGEKFVHKTLTRLFPDGLKEAQQFILARYQKRGFNTLTTEIEQLVQSC